MNRPDAAVRRVITDLQFGESLEGEVYLVRQKDLRTTSNGSLYIHAVLADKTGQILARMWNASEGLFKSMPEGGFMRFRGRVESFKGKPQFIIDGMQTVDDDAVALFDFLPSTTRDIEQMWQRTLEILRGVKHPELRALIAAFERDQEFVAAFKRSPAAMQLHHAFIGGLLEHTLNVLELALLVIPRYPRLNLDLVLAGVFLHDAGKTRELSCRTNFAYTDEGQLVGHIVQISVMLHEKAREVAAETGRPISPKVLAVLTHLILSHHGQYDFGSPKLPAMPEAIALHYLDNIDAKIQLFLAEIDKNADEDSDWTGYVPALGTRIFKPNVMAAPAE
ncbi:MAG: HD domain-containing protein [Planctomycetes bacterium]|nr:HD domain-containing protein [Planctomycetota bacterium]